MNERLIFFLSVPISEFGSSAIFYLLLPESPLARRSPDLLAYLEGHAIPALCVWALIAGLSAVLVPKLWRRRQNRSSKLTLFVKIGLLGLVIDLCSSLYLWLTAAVEAPAEQGSSILPALSARFGIYTLLFVAVVGCADQVAQWYARRRVGGTPPPRFGRA